MKRKAGVKTFFSAMLIWLTVGPFGNAGIAGSAVKTPDWGAHKFIRILGGPSGSGAYALYCAIAAHFDRIEGIRCSCLAGSSQQNIRAISRGTAQIGYSFDVDCADALNGTGFFKGYHGKIDNVSFLSSQFSRGIGFFVRADSPIRTIDDLKNRHIALGPKGFGANGPARAVLESYGITDKSIRKFGGRISRMTIGDSCMGLRDKSVDCQAVTVGMTGIYAPHIPLEGLFGLRLLPIDEEHLGKIREKYPRFIRAVIPGKIYRNQPEDYATVGMTVNLICAADLPDALAYKLLEVLYSRECRKDIYGAMKGGLPVILENGLLGTGGLPIHAGARRFYEDHGITAPPARQITPASAEEALGMYGGKWSEKDIARVEF